MFRLKMLTVALMFLFGELVFYLIFLLMILVSNILERFIWSSIAYFKVCFCYHSIFNTKYVKNYQLLNMFLFALNFCINSLNFNMKLNHLILQILSLPLILFLRINKLMANLIDILPNLAHSLVENIMIHHSFLQNLILLS